MRPRLLDYQPRTYTWTNRFFMFLFFSEFSTHTKQKLKFSLSIFPWRFCDAYYFTLNVFPALSATHLCGFSRCDEKSIFRFRCQRCATESVQLIRSVRTCMQRVCVDGVRGEFPLFTSSEKESLSIRMCVNEFRIHHTQMVEKYASTSTSERT